MIVASIAPVLSALKTLLQYLLTAEVIPLFEVKVQVAALRRQFEDLRSSLSRAVLEGQNKPVVSKAMRVLYDCEDIIDTYKVRRRLRNPLLRLKILHEVANRIAEIRPMLAEAAQACSVPPQSSPSLPSSSSPPPSFPDILPNVCIGREDSVEEIVRALLEKPSSASSHVVSIFGIAGLGKTTLAKRVLSHPQVRSGFQRFAWACMSRGTTTRDLAAEILCSVSPDLTAEEVHGMEEKVIIDRLREVQLNTRCLVVLVDLRSEADWDRISRAFPLREGPSRLLVTTRNRTLSLHIDPIRLHDHWLRFLYEEESFDLLMRIINRPETEGLDTGMEDSARKLLKLCGGLPLAISTIGGILSRRSTLTDWEDVRKNIGQTLRHLNEGRTLCKVVLDQCYDELDPKLKPLLLYLGLFPQGAEITGKQLFHLWTTEKFYLPHKKLPNEGKLDSTLKLKPLVDSGIVQVEEDKPTKRIKSYRLNNFIRELCILKAREEDLLHVLDLRSSKEPVKVIASSGLKDCSKIQRLSVLLGRDAKRDSCLGNILKAKRALDLRTLFLFEEKPCEGRNWKQMGKLFKKCKHLRVLMIEGLESVEGSVPGSIGDLFQLRYLSFKNTQVECLPQSLRNLVSVKTLDLRVRCTPTSPAVILPDVLQKMKRLKHLYLPRHFTTTDDKRKLRFYHLKNLRNLKNFTSSKCKESDLAELTSLRKLTVICSVEELDWFSSFARDRKITFKHIPSH
ncbi:disease resistance RPP8-like protein 3 [Punica granatum]|uniref:Disease resistance RPP8-like protein 3 n=1 Tax=Punica granatum TaxID=22663 RepID=A0A218WLP0_PUNGR|nr:disease resistance RPP8-like protein 3 [Punica granatum]OWM73171.1 hypothetical protein CDL15_Pgr001285 [Punica granatum]